MWTRARRLARRQPGRDLVLLFTFTILLPGLVLSAIGLWALLRDRAETDRQIRDRLDVVAAEAARRVDREAAAWRDAFSRAAASPSGAPTALPAWAVQAGAEPGALAVVVLTAGTPRVWPPHALAWDPWAPTSSRQIGAALASAESAELRDGNLAVALTRYRALLNQASEEDRPEVLLRLAITLRKTDRWADSRALLEHLATLTGERISSAPADLIGRAELAAHYESQGPARALTSVAHDLERDLILGKWVLDEPRYLDYIARTEGWLAETGSDSDPRRANLAAIDHAKRALSNAAFRAADAATRSAERPATLTSDPPDDPFVIFSTRRSNDTGSAGVVVVASKSWLAQNVWPDVLGGATDPAAVVTLVSEDGRVVFTSGSLAVEAGPISSHTLATPEWPWRIDVRPRNLSALRASMARDQGIWTALLASTIALLGLGTYFTARVVRRELEIATLKSDFVAAVSHEFRSPLTGIRQLGEMLLRGRVPNEERRQAYYERITHEADRLTRLVENLLNFARLEEGRKTYAFEVVDTGEWLKGVVEDFRPIAAEAGHQIAADIPSSLPTVRGDREALGCAVLNLLDNAVKYSPGLDTVWVDASAANGRVTIRVRDRGLGIASTDRARLFDRFYRGSSAARDTKGVGLGLNLTHHIVAAHGGSIEVESSTATGTVFAIHLAAAS